MINIINTHVELDGPLFSIEEDTELVMDKSRTKVEKILLDKEYSTLTTSMRHELESRMIEKINKKLDGEDPEHAETSAFYFTYVRTSNFDRLEWEIQKKINEEIKQVAIDELEELIASKTDKEIADFLAETQSGDNHVYKAEVWYDPETEKIASESDELSDEAYIMAYVDITFTY